MIVADRKPFDEIMNMIVPYGKILLIGCNECATVCAVGGAREAALLASQIRMKRQVEGIPVVVEEKTLERQCDPEYVQTLDGVIEEYDAVLSIACGCGVQFISEAFPGKKVLPGVNTRFMGVTEQHGIWAERCQGCGDCVLDRTYGICPVTRCAKSMMNGPCGGSQGGQCELKNDIPCAWQLIIEKMKAHGELDRFIEIEKPKDWSTARDAGPRRRVREDMKI